MKIIILETLRKIRTVAGNGSNIVKAKPTQPSRKLEERDDR